MTVTPSYPGIYIEELPSLVHSVTPAPTSIAVFVGYTNPFYSSTKYGDAIPLFSFADYQTNFGGFFSCPWQPDYVGQAVYQFFQNGGQTCYVVAVQAKSYYDSPGGTSIGAISAASVDVPATGGTFTFTAKQPVGVSYAASTTGMAGIAMQVSVSNLQNSQSTPGGPTDTADIVVTYGTTVELHRQVQIESLVATFQNSSLVTVTPKDTPAAYQAVKASPLVYGAGQVAPQPGYSVMDPVDFLPVFQQYQPLDKVPIFNLLATPGITFPFVTSMAVAYCESKRAFYIADTPSSQSTSPAWDVNSVVGNIGSLSPEPPVSINAAIYYPWLQTTDPVTGNTTDPVTKQMIVQPPSGFVAGMYAQTDSAQGVWQSPAGIQTTLQGTTGVDANGVMTDSQQGVLNPAGINCLRQFPSLPPVIWGARTTATVDPAYQQWNYVAVRRMALFIEQSLYFSLTWAVFQGNAEPLWTALTQEVTAFMLSLYRQNAFAGTTPSDSFLVQCDSTTTTDQDILAGRVNILVGFAPLRPAEFVVIQIAQLAGQTQS